MSMSPVILHLTSWHDLGSASLSWTCLAISDSWLSWLLARWNQSWPWFSDLILLLKQVDWHSGLLADCGYCHSICFTHLAQVLGDSTLGYDVPDCAWFALSFQSGLPVPKDELELFSQHKCNAFLSSFLWWIWWNNLMFSFTAVSSLAHYYIQEYFWTFNRSCWKAPVVGFFLPQDGRYEQIWTFKYSYI